MAITMIPFHGTDVGAAVRNRPLTDVDGRPRFLSSSGVFVLRRMTVGLVFGLLLVIVGFAARPHLVAPDVRPASSVGSNQINAETDGAAQQLLRVNDVSGNAGVPTDAVAAAATDMSRYVVQDGDSLWSIAAAQVPADQLDGYLAELVALNGDGALRTGQQLVLPG